MNIFYLDKDPCRAAELQYNKHVVKMILESAQMLCAAHHYYGNEDVPYKSTHLNHPSTVWVRENSKHYRWLFHHMLALGSEYTKRYGRKHLTIDKCFGPLSFLPPNIPTTDFIQPPQAMPDEYKDNCSVKAYWSYYIGDKSHIAGKLEKPYVTRFVTKAL